MDLKNLTAKNRNALLIGFGIIVTVIIMMASYFSMRVKPSGTNLQGDLSNVPNINLGNILQPNVTCKGEQVSIGPGILPESVQFTVKWTVTTTGTPKYQGDHVFEWTGNKGITAGIYPSPLTIKYSYNHLPVDDTVQANVAWKPKVAQMFTEDETSCTLNLKYPAQGSGGIQINPGTILVPNLPENPPDQPDDSGEWTVSTDEGPQDEWTAETTDDTPSSPNEPNDQSDENLFDDEMPDAPSEPEGNLKPFQDILTCKLPSSTLTLSKSEKIYLHCDVKPSAIVTAFLISGSFDPSKDPPPENIVKVFFTDKPYSSGSVQTPLHFIIPFDGKNSYDSSVEPGDYSFIVAAAPDQTYERDFSVQKFKIFQEAPLSETPPSDDQSAPTETVTPPPVTTTPPAQPTTPPPASVEKVEISKCQTPYPKDIKGHWAEALIRKAYDTCMLKGYADGTFRPNQPATRAEAVKTALAVAGISPQPGCTDDDCGSSFADLEMWQGPWIRVAEDKQIIKSRTYFRPNAPMTRAEASSMIVRLFRLPIPKNCYDSHCGAGYGDNIFYDIDTFWQGYYIRALWDLGLQSGQNIIRGVAPHVFEPNRPITRAEILKILVKVKEAKGTINN